MSYPFLLSGGCVSFILSGVLLVYLLFWSYPQFSGGFPYLHLLGSLPILWFTRVCSSCGSFSCASSSAFAALLPGGVLWLLPWIRVPSLFLPPFDVHRLPVAHMKLPPFFLSFLSMRLFFGHFPRLLADVFLFSAFFPANCPSMWLSFLFAAFGSFAVAC